MMGRRKITPSSPYRCWSTGSEFASTCQLTSRDIAVGGKVLCDEANNQTTWASGRTSVEALFMELIFSLAAKRLEIMLNRMVSVSRDCLSGGQVTYFSSAGICPTLFCFLFELFMLGLHCPRHPHIPWLRTWTPHNHFCDKHGRMRMMTNVQLSHECD